jgi:malate dehydrogenase (oxaloacetate-decarboxylating)(NADP+)
LSEHKFLFYGAGEAGVGIANMITSYVAKELGCTEEKARERIWLVDSKGLVHSARTDALAHHKQPYAHKLPGSSASASKSNDVLLDAVKMIKPTALVGVSAQGGTFTEAVCKEMATISKAPLIFALSNPTSKAECTAEQAYKWTDGRAVFASGSPFDPVTLPNGKKFIPGQGNNAYIFPGVGLGAIVAHASTLTDDDLSVAAATRAKTVTQDILAAGCAYTPLSEIREVSLLIAAAVAENVIKDGRGDKKVAQELNTYDKVYAKCKSSMYTPSY